MSVSFRDAARAYREDKLNELAQSERGYRFLLLRALSRGAPVQRLAADFGIDLSGVANRDRLEHLYASDITEEQLVATLRSVYAEERAARRLLEPDLTAELYKMQAFDWGGLYQNSLEKTIVDNYVKKIRSFDVLNSKIDNELTTSLRGYVQCSWYNHWTSIMIEDLFKDHPAVLPTVGLIKKVDFFIGRIPYDLKVTSLPEGFVAEQRQTLGLRSEMSELRRVARDQHISYDRNLASARLLEHLWAIVNDHPSTAARDAVLELRRVRMDILSRSESDPTALIGWLYENQGVRRFDASNRLFLVLVNSGDFFASWKLKRARDLLAVAINDYLDDPHRETSRQVTFTWEGQAYTVKSDAIILRHEA